VIDVPPKLSAQVRVFATGNGRKTDPVDAHSVAMAAFHNHGLLHVEVDDDLLVLGMLADRRDELGRARTQTVNRLHRLLLELLAGGPKKDLSAKQARELIVTVKPRDLPGKTRRRLAVELIGERESIDRKIKTGDKEIEALVLERDSTAWTRPPDRAERPPVEGNGVDRSDGRPSPRLGQLRMRTARGVDVQGCPSSEPRVRQGARGGVAIRLAVGSQLAVVHA
jgi:hypothetical protein